MSEVHPFRFRLITVDRVYRFATDTSGMQNRFLIVVVMYRFNTLTVLNCVCTVVLCSARYWWILCARRFN